MSKLIRLVKDAANAALEAAPCDAARATDRIAPTADCPHPTPPVGGNWCTEPDGGIRPADGATAAAAGLAWPAPADSDH